MNTKQLLNEWRNYLNSLNNPRILNEISLRAFTAEFPEFDTSSFSPQLKGNTLYLDIIANTIRSGTAHSVDDYKSQFEYFKTSMWNNRDTWSDDFKSKFDFERNTSTATYEDIQLYQQTRAEHGKGSKKTKENIYQQILDAKDPAKYETIYEDSNWIICYPESKIGSISLARSYWNGSKLEYDMTFNVSRGIGDNVGEMNWCTSIDGFNNQFIKYHISDMLHMYYCIKKQTNTSDPNRKLCISFTKHNNALLMDTSTATVDGNNNKIKEDNIIKALGTNIFQKIKDDALNNRLDLLEYYINYTLENYIENRSKILNDEAISDFAVYAKKILEMSRESEQIHDYIANNEKNPILLFLTGINIQPENISFAFFDKIKDRINEIDFLFEVLKKSPDREQIFDYYLNTSTDLDLIQEIMLRFYRRLNKEKIESLIERNMLKYRTLIKIINEKYAEDKPRLYDYFEDKYKPLISKFPK